MRTRSAHNPGDSLESNTPYTRDRSGSSIGDPKSVEIASYHIEGPAQDSSINSDSLSRAMLHECEDAHRIRRQSIRRACDEKRSVIRVAQCEQSVDRSRDGCKEWFFHDRGRFRSPLMENRAN